MVFHPSAKSGKLPCLVMSHGGSALKEMDLDAFAGHFTDHIPISCLIFDNRCPRLPTAGNRPKRTNQRHPGRHHTSTRDDVDATKIWVWEAPTAAVMRSTSEDLTKESGRSSARCLRLMGKEFQRLVRPDFAPGLYATFEKGTAFCDSMVWACQLMPVGRPCGPGKEKRWLSFLM